MNPGSRLDASVLIATAGRPDRLDDTLASLARSAEDSALRWEVVVVDNRPGRAETTEVLARHRGRMPLVPLKEPIPGKNHALNRAVDHAGGGLFLFTDDDVLLPEGWVESLVRASAEHPDATVFGGPIDPVFPRKVGLDLDHPLVRSAFVIMDRGPDPVALPPTAFWGPHVAIRRTVFDDGIRFNATVGPDGSRTYVMGSETELLRRLEAAGHTGWYLPDLRVRHRIRPDQLDADWLAARAYRMGRGEVYLGGIRRPTYIVRQRLLTLLRGLVPTTSDRATLRRMERAYWRGALAEYRSTRSRRPPSPHPGDL